MLKNFNKKIYQRMLKNFNKKIIIFLVIFFSNYFAVSKLFCNFALSKRKNKKLNIKKGIGL